MGRSTNGRRKGAWLLALVVLALALALSACGGSASSSSTGGAKKSLRVAVLMPGTANDGSWGQAVATGAKAFGARYGAKVTVAENLDDPTQYQQQANAFASAGYDLVIVANGAIGEVTAQLAKQYPNVKFGQIAASIPGLTPNVSTAVPQFQNGTFQAGVLAGLLTKTNKVGAIGGFQFPAVTAEMEAFLLGARWANPKVSVTRTYINSWTDTGKAKAAAQAQAAKGVDIIFSATDQASQGIFQLAQQGSTLKYVIPQYFDKNAQAPTVVLTSVLYNLQGITGSFIKMLAEGHWASQNAAPGLDQQVGELAPYHGLASAVPARVQATVAGVRQRIASGALKIPSLEVLGKPSSADQLDPTAIGPVAGK